METTSAPPVVQVQKSSGRWLIALGLVLAVAAPLAYGWQIQNKRLFAPWYVPVVGTVAVGLLLVALARRRSVWRFFLVGLLTVLALGEWSFLLWVGRLPAYAGPVAEGKDFPQFTTTRSDGTAFDQQALRGDKNTVLVFFRGHW
jgi:hypothetical protein